MNDPRTQAVLDALEGQRNNALNGLVNTQAALTIAQARVVELEKQLATATAPKEEQAA